MQTKILRMVHSHFYQNQLRLIHVQAMKRKCSCPLHLYQIRQESYILLTPVSYGLVQPLWTKQCNSQILYIHNWRALLIIKPTWCTNFSNLFWNKTLHVSDGSSVHHQEFFTVHTVHTHTQSNKVPKGSVLLSN